MTLGLLLLAAAFCLTGYNIYQAKKAQSLAADVMGEIKMAVPAPEVNEVEDQKEEQTEEEIPIHVAFPEKEMPTVKINDERYIGILEMPSIGITLPVFGGEWSYSKLRTAPCRYSGSVYKDNMVIAAHNYSSHFGKIKNILPDSEIIFTDIEGNVFHYVVGWLDVLEATDIEEMKDAEEWDLTLFTCTYGGKSRYALRCIRVE